MLTTVTDLNLLWNNPSGDFYDLSGAMPSFIKPFVCLERLTISQSLPCTTPHIDQVAQCLVEPSFLPRLESLTITEYPSWPHFFLCIQKRQSGFLSGHFQTALTEIIIKRPVHGALLDHLRESLAGRYIGPISMLPCPKSSVKWPALPFDHQKLSTDGLLCCYSCHRAGLEMGCIVSPSNDAFKMLVCDRQMNGYGKLNKVFAP